jgi:hypothetical protein
MPSVRAAVASAIADASAASAVAPTATELNVLQAGRLAQP